MQNRTSEMILGNINVTAAELIFYGMLTGAAALWAANFFGAEIGLAIPINGFTAFVSLTLGAPGVLALCVISLLL